MEGAAADAEEFGGGGTISITFLEGFFNQDSFILLKCDRGSSGRGRDWRHGVRGEEGVTVPDIFGNIFNLEFTAGGEDDHTLDAVTQFADIAGPRITGKEGEGLVGKFR